VIRPLRLGISTCPNDTFAFHALLSGELRPRGIELAIELCDIQELNERLRDGTLDAAKISFATALELAAELVVLPSGSALGFGVGPVLLAAAERALPEPGAQPAPRVLCPGAGTTASLLWALLHPGVGVVEQVVFSAILPALAARRADFGVCIHEARFTWREHGLHLVEDLGAAWEARTGAPLPLGGLCARRAVGREPLERLQEAVRASLERSLADPERALPTMRRHAQEASDAAIRAHVELYVNEWTVDLGAEGRRALAALAREARAAGLAPAGALAVLGTTT
jgi:1,4-dihydroxy-6-naphthoate synthase